MAFAGNIAVAAAPSAPAAVEPAAEPSRLAMPLAVALLIALGAVLFAIRLTGLPNLLENEYRVGAEVLDVLQHGNWLCPHDVLGNTDKPPMLAWLAALASWPFGRVTRFSLYLPTAVATVATAIAILLAGERFGARAGLLGAVAYLLSHVATQQMATARWDGLFSLTITLTALAAFHAWTRGGGWTWFWLAAAVSTLTKGPLGPILAAFGLLAVPWERRTGRPHPLRGSHAAGVALYVAIAIGWLLLAWWRVGNHLIDNMIRGELLGHVVEHHVGYRFFKPLGDFAADFAPWSVLTLVGLRNVWRTPALVDDERRFERFLACWLVSGLVLFCLSPHNQARLLYPLAPPAALLAGRELQRLTVRWSLGALGVAGLVTLAIALPIFTVQYHRLIGRTDEVRRTLALQTLAARIRDVAGEDFPLTYVEDGPYALQLLLASMHPTATFDDAAALLRGDTAAVVVTGNLQRLQRLAGPDVALHELAHAVVPGAAPFLHVVSNRTTWPLHEPVATRVGRWRVTLDGVRLGPAWDDRLVLHDGDRHAAATIVDDGADAREVAVDVDGADTRRTLAAGEAWRIALP